MNVECTKAFIDDAPTIEERPKMNCTFMASPTEIIKVGEPLSNSDEIKQAFEKGEIYKRGFEEVKKRYEQPKGKWIWKGHHLVCSNCGSSEDRRNFCPNCGADMRGNV